MSFGLRVFRSDGVLATDTNTFTYQVMGQWVLDFSASTTANPVNYTLTIPGFDPAKCAFFLLPTRAQDVPGDEDSPGNAKCYPYVTISSGQVVVKSRNPSGLTTTTSTARGILRGIAVRFSN